MGLSSDPMHIILPSTPSTFKYTLYVYVITAFSTDGLLKKFSLITLEDNKNFFPPYYAVPFIRADTLNKYPEIAEILKKLGDLLDEETMIELNYQVDEMQKDPKEVAREFLIKNNLI